MLFNSTLFLFLFLPVTLLAFYTVPPAWRMGVLGAASLVFYGAARLTPLVFLILSCLWAFAMAFLLYRHTSRWLLALGVSFPLAVLFLFRYLGFTLDSLGVDEAGRQPFYFFLSVLLPAGISFYTFQILAYTIDVRDHNRAQPDRNILHFITFISFFPQLIAGPIVRYHQIADQLRAVTRQRHLDPDVAGGVKLLAVGLFGKVFFADMLGIIQERYDVQGAASALDASLSVLAYSLRIYYDFWAYSIIAIGLAKLFAISLPRNFREPYLSRNPREFWRRWHVTLSYFLRDYVYIRLGGNQAYARNILFVFALCGLWHGAGWNFVVWGLYHAVLVLAYTAVAPAWDRMPAWLQMSLTFLLVSLGWPLFYLGFADYGLLMKTIFWSGAWTPQAFGPLEWSFTLAVTAWTFLAREDRWLHGTDGVTSALGRVIGHPVAWAGMVYLSVLFFSWSKTFIYFRF